MKIRTEKQLNIIILLAAIIITAISFSILSKSTQKYIVSEKRDIYSNHVKFIYEFYEDVDGEEKELIKISKGVSWGNITGIQIFKKELVPSLYNQFNLGNIDDSLSAIEIEFFDINNDKVKECFVIYQNKDSVFLNIRDIKNDKWLLERKKVLEKPIDTYTKDWSGFALRNLGVWKNKENEYEIYFLTTAGFALKPRGIFKYNLSTHEISDRTFGNTFNLSHSGFRFYDIDLDGTPEILLCGNAAGNTHRLKEEPKYDDYHVRLFILDMDLNILKVHTFSKEKEEGAACFLSINPNPRISELLVTYQSKKFRSKTYKINRDLSLSLIPHQNLTRLINITEIKSNYFAYDEEFIYKLDTLFNEIKKIRNSSRFIDINLSGSDFPDDIIFVNEIILFDENLDIIQTLPDNRFTLPNGKSISWRFINSGKKLEIIRNGVNKIHYSSVEVSKTYIYRYLLIFPLFIFSLLILFFIKNSYLRFLVFFSYLNLSSNQSASPILLISSKGKILFNNKAAQRRFKLLGKGKTEKISIINTIIPELQNKIETANLKRRGFEEDIDLKINDSIRKAKITIKNVMAFRSILLAVFVRIDDYSKEIYSERNKVLAHSIQKVAHEIKTPLSSVLLNLDAVEQKTTNNEINKDLDVARNEISRIRNFINNFLKFANMQEPAFEKIDVSELIENSILRFASYTEKNIFIEKNIDDNLRILGDVYQLEEVFQVFIENSIDAMKGKGKIIISANQIETGGGTEIKFEITDFGEGIPDKIINSIFDPYVTTKKHGTGMGLSIAKKILEDHGSKLNFKTIKGKGTTFSFNMKSI